MAKNLLSIGGLYVKARGQETHNKGEGAAWTIMGDKPDILQIWILSLRSTFEINFKDVTSIEICDMKGKGKISAVKLSLINGEIHMLDVKKQAKAEAARETLIKIKSSIGV